MTNYTATKIGVASRTDEPAWAHECMHLMQVTGKGHSIKDVMHHIEIDPTYNKQEHFRRLHAATGIAFKYDV